MARKIIGIIIAGAVIIGCSYIGYSYDSNNSPVVQKSVTVASQPSRPIESNNITKVEPLNNELLINMSHYLEEDSYKFINVTQNQISVLTGQPGYSITPEALAKALLGNFNGKLLSPGNLENSKFILPVSMNGNKAYIVNMINPTELQTHSGDAYITIVNPEGKPYTLSEVRDAIDNGDLTGIDESYPFSQLTTQDAIDYMANHNDKFIYGSYI